MGDRLATIDMGRQEGGATVPLFGGRELGPHLTQCGLGRGLLPYQIASRSIQPFGHNRHGPKIGDCAPFGAAGSPSYTMWPGPRPTSMPSFILVHPTAWPQYTTVGTDRQRHRQDNGPIAYGKPLYKRSPENVHFFLAHLVHAIFPDVW